MARYTGPRCRLCRREGMKLFIKGDKCLTDKCPLDRRPHPPGMHGRFPRKPTDYAIRLREKQRLRRMYGVMDCQFRRYFEMADRMRGPTGANLLVLLERRLDNVVYRLGWATSRSEARQLVRHGHVRVNGHKVNIPSYLVRAGDVVELQERSKQLKRVQEALETLARRGVPPWLELDREQLRARVVTLPSREDVVVPVNEQLIVEFYSK